MAQASLKSCATAVRRRGRPLDQALRARRCEQILRTATRVFAARGYQNTDVQFIADPLRISKGTVYRYFPSKQRLFLAAVQRGVERLDRDINQAIELVADPVDRLVVATRTYLQFFETHPDLVELFIQERAAFRGRTTPIYFQHGKKVEPQWRAIYEQLIAAGRLRAVPVDRLLNVIGDLVYGTMFTNHIAGRKKSFDEQAADIIDVIFNGILSPIERDRRAPGIAAAGATL